MKTPIPFLNLKPLHERIEKELDEVLSRVRNSGNFIGGDEVTKFESHFADYVGVDHCVGCGNGTDALELALEALGVGKGDEVVVPAVSWASTALAVSRVGATPVFVDVLPHEYTIDPELIPDKITTKTKAIIAVHLYGLPARMPEIVSVASDHGVSVIEDCAQAHGASINGQMVGSFGLLATYSFYPTKALGALGDGGAVLTDNTELADKIRKLANYGALQGGDHDSFGRNSRLDPIQAAILALKLRHLNEWRNERESIANLYEEILPLQFQSKPHGYVHAYYQVIARYENRTALEEFFNKLGVETKVNYPIPLPFLSCFAFMEHREADFPIASNLCRQVISLPLWIGLRPDELKLRLKNFQDSF